MLRGLRCGLLLGPCRGIAAGLWMSLRFSVSERDKQRYLLTEPARRYIAETDLKRAEPLRARLRRALSPLPPV